VEFGPKFLNSEFLAQFAATKHSVKVYTVYMSLYKDVAKKPRLTSRGHNRKKDYNQ
jgi:hypothetical protein